MIGGSDPLSDLLVRRNRLESSMAPMRTLIPQDNWSSLRHDHTGNVVSFRTPNPRRGTFRFFDKKEFYDPKTMDQVPPQTPAQGMYRATNRDVALQNVRRRKEHRVPGIQPNPINVLPINCEEARNHRKRKHEVICSTIFGQPPNNDDIFFDEASKIRVYKTALKKEEEKNGVVASTTAGDAGSQYLDPAFLMNIYRPNGSNSNTSSLARPTNFKIDLWESFGAKGEDLALRHANIGGWFRSSLNPYPLTAASKHGLADIGKGYEPQY